MVELFAAGPLLADHPQRNHAIEQVQESGAYVGLPPKPPEQCRKVGSALQLVDVTAAGPTERDNMLPLLEFWVQRPPWPGIWLHEGLCVEFDVAPLMVAIADVLEDHSLLLAEAAVGQRRCQACAPSVGSAASLPDLLDGRDRVKIAKLHRQVGQQPRHHLNMEAVSKKALSANLGGRRVTFVDTAANRRSGVTAREAHQDLSLVSCGDSQLAAGSFDTVVRPVLVWGHVVAVRRPPLEI